MMDEFDLIQKYFTPSVQHNVLLGVGDDAALLPAQSETLVVACDTLVAGTHFFEDDPPESIGHRALAVNLSDLAAMGARPSWFTLALTLPKVEPTWLASFSNGLHHLADKEQITLIGGDTTSGPLSITITAIGTVPQEQALRRDGGKPGDILYITQPLGQGALGFNLRKHSCAHLNSQMHNKLINHWLYPLPQVHLGQLLRPFANSCIDLSDGLYADLNHLLHASGVGASLDRDALFHPDLQASFSNDVLEQAITKGGEDYCLCFSIPKNKCFDAENQLKKAGYQPTAIGKLTQRLGLRVNNIPVNPSGWTHFKKR